MKARVALLAGLAIVCSTGAAVGAPLPEDSTDQDRARQDRADWRSVLHWPSSCEQDWRSSHATGAGVQTWRASKNRRVVAVTCIRGAYQGTSMLYVLYSANRPTKAIGLHIYTDPGSGTPTPTPTRTKRPLGTVSFTRKTSTLWILDKFRGVGDCGISSKFKLSGTRFVPTVTRAKAACDGKGPYDPAKWPKLTRLSP